ncbi:hypothetical protein [Synechococcus sp. UW179A]|nr:hypothetical protein [Synechococcus sp. UW179A]
MSSQPSFLYTSNSFRLESLTPAGFKEQNRKPADPLITSYYKSYELEQR